MKESIADIWLVGIIMVFILIFACYITITINYTASFKLKNEVLSIIERHKGMTDQAATCGNYSNLEYKNSTSNVCINAGAYQTINLYLLGNAYTAKGQCPTDEGAWVGVKDIMNYDSLASGSYDYPANAGEKYYYCFAKYDSGSGGTGRFKSIYYKVRLFYNFEFPVLTEFLSVRVDGMTDEIYNPNSDPFAENGDQF